MTEQQYLEIVGQSLMHIFVPLALMVAVLAFALTMPLWPRRKYIDMVLTRDEEGAITHLEFLTLKEGEKLRRSAPRRLAGTEE